MLSNLNLTAGTVGLAAGAAILARTPLEVALRPIYDHHGVGAPGSRSQHLIRVVATAITAAAFTHLLIGGCVERCPRRMAAASSIATYTATFLTTLRAPLNSWFRSTRWEHQDTSGAPPARVEANRGRARMRSAIAALAVGTVTRFLTPSPTPLRFATAGAFALGLYTIEGRTRLGDRLGTALFDHVGLGYDTREEDPDLVANHRIRLIRAGVTGIGAALLTYGVGRAVFGWR